MPYIPARDSANLWSKRTCKSGDMNLVVPLPCSLLGRGSLSCSLHYSWSRPPMIKSFYQSSYDFLVHASTKWLGNKTCKTRDIILVTVTRPCCPCSRATLSLFAFAADPALRWSSPFYHHVTLISGHTLATCIHHRTCKTWEKNLSMLVVLAILSPLELLALPSNSA
jgi:hypothetical protein